MAWRIGLHSRVFSTLAFAGQWPCRSADVGHDLERCVSAAKTTPYSTGKVLAQEYGTRSSSKEFPDSFTRGFIGAVED
jgi:hypothetical protein